MVAAEAGFVVVAAAVALPMETMMAATMTWTMSLTTMGKIARGTVAGRGRGDEVGVGGRGEGLLAWKYMMKRATMMTPFMLTLAKIFLGDLQERRSHLLSHSHHA